MSHLSEWLSSTNHQTKSVGEDVEKMDLLCIVGGIVNWHSPYEKQYDMPQKIKNATTI